MPANATSSTSSTTAGNRATTAATANRARRRYALGAVKDHVATAAAELAPAFGIGTVLGFGSRDNPTSDHPKGLALDLMVTGSRGDRLAEYVVGNGDRLGVTYLIWSQQINSLDGRGWRAMPDRGSVTDNHYDHVHVSFSAAGGTGGPVIPVTAGGTAGATQAGVFDISELQDAIWRVTLTALVVLGGAGLVAIGLSAITAPARKAAVDLASDAAAVMPQGRAAKAAGGAAGGATKGRIR